MAPTETVEPPVEMLESILGTRERASLDLWVSRVFAELVETQGFPGRQPPPRGLYCYCLGVYEAEIRSKQCSVQHRNSANYTLRKEFQASWTAWVTRLRQPGRLRWRPGVPGAVTWEFKLCCCQRPRSSEIVFSFLLMYLELYIPSRYCLVHVPQILLWCVLIFI